MVAQSTHTDAHDVYTGAIYSIVTFYACAAPRTTFLLFAIVPVPAWLCVSGLFLWDTYSSIYTVVSLAVRLRETFRLTRVYLCRAATQTTQDTSVASSLAQLTSSPRHCAFSDPFVAPTSSSMVPMTQTRCRHMECVVQYINYTLNSLRSSSFTVSGGIGSGIGSAGPTAFTA